MHSGEQPDRAGPGPAGRVDANIEHETNCSSTPSTELGDHGAGTSRTASALTITLAASLLVLIIDVVASVPMAPRMVIFEDIICRNYYAELQNGAGLMDCKVEPVQSELAQINAWKETFDTIPGLLVSVPYGALAHRIGRNKVLILALVGTILSDAWVAFVCSVPHVLPLRAIWFSGLFQLIGGGAATVVSMCFTMIGHACTTEQRTGAFSQVHAAVLLSELVSIPIGSALISVNPWIPVLGAIAFMTLSTIATFFVANKIAPDSATKEEGTIDETSSLLPPSKVTLQDRLDQVGKATSWINRNVVLLLVAFFCCQLSRQFTGVFLQYSSIKFHWEYAKASYLVALAAGVKLLVLIMLVPRLSHYFIHKRGLLRSQAEKYITVLSGICLTFGSLFIFFSTSVATLIIAQCFIALGFAFTVTARSFLSSLVDPRYFSLLYTSVTAVTYGGVIVGGPLLAAAFRLGLKLDLLGMPFLLTAALFGISTLTVLAARGKPA